jgi:polyisoprenoid-binding protein YceI
MKKIISTVFLISLFSITMAQHYKPVEDGSTVQFKIAHQMIFKSTVTGTFSGIKGLVQFDPNDLAGSSFDVSVASQTINTGISMRDNDLKKEKYFDVQHYPRITIKSKKITKGAHENEYILAAVLTMKGKTTSVLFSFTAVLESGGYVFKGHFHINRLDFNVGPENSIDKDAEIDLNIITR